jgi:hypothetical protein
MQALITVTEQNGTAGLQTVASGTQLHSRPATRCQDLQAARPKAKAAKSVIVKMEAGSSTDGNPTTGEKTAVMSLTVG